MVSMTPDTLTPTPLTLLMKHDVTINHLTNRKTVTMMHKQAAQKVSEDSEIKPDKLFTFGHRHLIEVHQIWVLHGRVKLR